MPTQLAHTPHLNKEGLGVVMRKVYHRHSNNLNKINPWRINLDECS